MSTVDRVETSERLAFYDAIEPENMAALWSVLDDLVTTEPKSPCVTHLWRYEQVRNRLIASADLISAEEAVRRVLVLENPALRGESRITTSLYCGVQLVMPGEVAPAHRHTQSALRFVFESEGGYTTVGEQRMEMAAGDFVITPSAEWHAHGNSSDTPVIWLDGLDIPLVQFLSASFADSFDEGSGQQIMEESSARIPPGYEANMLPVESTQRSLSSPVSSYPYERSREALERLERTGPLDPCQGFKLRYVNPTNGEWAMPTIGACLQLLPAGLRTEVYTSTDATVFVPVEGRGRAVVGETVLEWAPRDVFVIPAWCPLRLEADETSVLFSFSDRPVQEKLGLWRELRGNGNAR